MKVYIDGENCRKGLTRILVNAGDITNPRQMENYRLQELLADVLGENDIKISYYASEIKLPYDYQPSSEIMNHVNRIRDYSRKWVPSLKQQGITYIKAGNLKVKQAKECRKCHEVQE